MVGFLIIILFVLLFFSETKNPQEKTFPTPTRYPLPTVSFQRQKLKIAATIPEQDPTKQYLPIRQVSFIFNAPIEASHFFYTINPVVETNVKNGKNPNTIIISANDIWKEGITTITILPNTTSINGLRLGTPFIYKINTAFPKGGE